MNPLKSKTFVCATLIVVGLGLTLSAQPAATYKTGAEFYMAYRQAFAKAKTIDDLLPWMSKSKRDQMGAMPAGERTKIFGMIKAMDDHTNIKVVKETASATGADLQVEAVSTGSKSKVTATITLVKEAGAWKLDQEEWKGGTLPQSTSGS